MIEPALQFTFLGYAARLAHPRALYLFLLVLALGLVFFILRFRR